MCIELRGTKIRFIDSRNFLNFSVDELRRRLDMEPFYFPSKLNLPKLYNSTIPPPPESEYFYCLDSHETIEEKQKQVRFSQENQKLWIVKEELVKTCYLRAKVTLIACLDFLAKNYTLQAQLIDKLQYLYATPPNKQELDFYHAFSKPVVSYASYAFNLFLLTLRNLFRKVCVVKQSETGKHHKLSVAENEWTSYLSYTLNCPPDQVFSAFSNPKGQLCIANSFPDIVGPGFTGWFNGCYFHAHERKMCLFQQKSKDDYLAEKKEAEFMRKLQALQTARPDLKNHYVMWECEWREKKKKDSHVQHFMSNVYKPLPPFRLIPRISGASTKY